ncbi:MAG: double-strand break repair helicase AddA [Alphaproteobacteria bacterium]|nr:double-strand break repair helicase AddA [Alphaproteobacteria bacterium]
MEKEQSLENQKIASNPKLSVWVSASAGTGKTTVLINRLLRLFLNDVDPSKVLCLTYTNAGAIEMQNRIYKKARDWAIISDEELKTDLTKLLDETDKNIDFDNLFLKARKLFSKLIDNPIPLKIYTIHAFCQSVLKRFPIEAGITPHFKIIEDSDVKILLNEAYQKLIHTLKSDKNIDYLDVFKSFDYLMKNTPESDFDSMIESIINGREHFIELLSKYKTKDGIISELKKKIFNTFPFAIDSFIDDEVAFKTNVLSHIPDGFIDELKRLFLLDNGKTSAKKLDIISAFLSSDNVENKFDIYKTLLLNADNSIPKDCILNKKSILANPSFVDDISRESERLFQSISFINSVKVFKATSAVLDFGLTLNHIYDNLKKKRGVMDFTDLITTVKKLFDRENISSWILYKLDGGISHILIDEAQDTSPIQWKIVDKLTEEFFTTGSTEKNVKSLFSVGDRKQSIFSFQGANIKLFEKYKQHFKEKITSQNYPFYDLPLNLSFRSCKNILNTVDDVIKNSEGVLLPDEKIEHIPNRNDSDGYVEVMPLIKQIKDKTENCFKPPVENITVFNSSIEMANVLAKKIRYLLDNEYISDGVKDGQKYIRKIEPKDIMILVRTRKFADNITKALLTYNIPLAGRDKLSLSDNIAVEDLISLLKFVLFNYDDLSLAEVLKSPLYNLTDDDLFTLCYDRKDKTLFEVICENEKYKDIADDLKHLVSFSKKTLPFEFFDYVLKVQNKRSNFISRLGIEVIDILNGFLSQCLSYDNLKLGKSLSDFYEWFSLNDVEIKRNMEQVNNTVRIMTVHSSKGLEAPIVFLYNANATLSSSKDRIIWSEDFPMYKVSGFQNISNYFENIYAVNKRANQEEFYRLLYVAMTRARDRLYVLGAENKKEGNEKSWYSCIKESLLENIKTKSENDDAIIFANDIFTEDKALVLGEKENGILSNSPVLATKKNNILPQFFNEKIDDINKKNIEIEPKSPLQNNETDTSLSRGKFIHKILEHLSKNKIDDIEKFIDFEISRYEKFNSKFQDVDLLKNNVLELYQNPKYNFIFNGNSLSETEIITSENNISKILRVDKVVFYNNDIWIIDYKTDKATDKMPLSYKKQLYKYKDALTQIYPNKKIHTAILWINDLKFDEII